MDKLPAMGTQIFQISKPTFQAFVPELLKNKDSIQSIPRVEHVYGPHPRQKLDLYPAANSTAPILVFLYGGGLVLGDKIMPSELVPDSLVYANIGSFYAQRGYTTIVSDYRRVNFPAQGTGEDAIFPSGGEDVALTLQWIEKYLAEKGIEKRDVFLMGNSAGGVHISTFLFEPRWKEKRLGLVGDGGRIKLRGVILVAVPCHFDSALESRSDTLKTYFGSVEGTKKLCPLGLFKSVIETKESQKEIGVPDVLIMTGGLDPYDEIIRPNEELVELWKKSWGGAGLEYQILKTHNHISVPLALGTGDEQAEEWGIDAAKWMSGKRENF